MRNIRRLRNFALTALVVFFLINFAPAAFAQVKARRQRIRFPADCTNDKPAGIKNWTLQANCAAAIESVLADLPREDCDYEPYLKKNSFDSFLTYATEERRDAVRFFPLSANKYLVEIVCSEAAYNVSNVYLLYDESRLAARARVLEFPSLEFDYDEDTNTAKTIKNVAVKTLGGRWFNRKTRELIVFVKARGLGDAGRYARYSFPNGAPRLEEFRAKFSWTGRGYNVNDVIKSAPQTWKRYYP